MRINFRLQKTVPWLWRLFADVSLLRSSSADPREIEVWGEPSGTTTHIFPPVHRFPLSVSLHQCPYSLHLDTTLYQEKHRIKIKKYQIVFFYVVYLSLKPSGYYMYHRVLHSKTLYSANRIQFYVSYDSHKRYLTVTQCACSAFTARCEMYLYMQCKLNSVLKGHRSILTNVISTKQWQSQNA